MKRLQKLWYQKLKNSGFVDIENPNGKENTLHSLRTWHSQYFCNQLFKEGFTQEKFQEQADYYRLTSEFYWTYSKFKNKTEKKIWKYYSEGCSRRKIAKILNRPGYSSDSIQLILSKLKKIMHTRSWPTKASKKDDDSESQPVKLSIRSSRRHKLYRIHVA